MNELQASLETLLNNGNWKDAIVYAVVAFIGFSVIAAFLRSGFLILLGAIAAFYIFSLQSPDSHVDLNAAAADKVITMMVDKSTCAADSVGEFKNIGKIIRNGDVIDIAKKCGLMP